MNYESNRIKDMPENERPRERLILQGPEVLKDEELLAIILGSGTKGENIVSLSQRIIFELNGLNGMLNASLNEVKQIKGVKEAKGCKIIAMMELSRRIRSFKVSFKEKITKPQDVAEKLYSEMNCLNQEVLKLIILNTKNEVIKTKDVFKGTLNSSLVHPREIFNEAIKFCAASIIICHNHPSGDPTPSKEDIQITKRISDCGKLLGIHLTDHIIVGNNIYVSLKEKGII